MYFRYLIIIPPWGKAWPFIWTNACVFPSPKDALCPVCFELAQCFWRRWWKCETFTNTRWDKRQTGGQTTDNRRSEKITSVLDNRDYGHDLFVGARYCVSFILVISYRYPAKCPASTNMTPSVHIKFHWLLFYECHILHNPLSLIVFCQCFSSNPKILM